MDWISQQLPDRTNAMDTVTVILIVVITIVARHEDLGFF